MTEIVLEQMRGNQEAATAGRVDHPVVPQPGARIIGMALRFVPGADRRLGIQPSNAPSPAIFGRSPARSPGIESPQCGSSIGPSAPWTAFEYSSCTGRRL